MSFAPRPTSSALPLASGDMVIATQAAAASHVAISKHVAARGDKRRQQRRGAESAVVAAAQCGGSVFTRFGSQGADVLRCMRRATRWRPSANFAWFVALGGSRVSFGLYVPPSCMCRGSDLAIWMRQTAQIPSEGRVGWPESAVFVDFFIRKQLVLNVRSTSSSLSSPEAPVEPPRARFC